LVLSDASIEIDLESIPYDLTYDVAVAVPHHIIRFLIGYGKCEHFRKLSNKEM